jgi:hypothetical protein
VEPDVRFGGTALGAGPVVLFRLVPTSETVASSGYPLAVTVLDLAASLVLPISNARLDDVVNLTITALAAGVTLTIGERSRLSARLRWLIAAKSSPSTPTDSSPSTGANFSPSAGAETNRLRRRATNLSPGEREVAGQVLLTVAVAVAGSKGSGGLVDSATVQALVTAYRVIGLSDELLFQRLHQHSLDDDDAPVIVRRPRAEPSGHPLPRRSPPPTVAAPAKPEHRSNEPIQLHQSVITRTLAQSEAVSALLRDIFVDDEAVPVIESPVPGPFADPDHVPSKLMRQLATRLIWSRADFAELADQHGMLPDSALDVINEMTIELTGEPAIEGDDELAVHHEVIREVLGDSSDAI